jgi:predicted alpha/beta-fold hydrolase
VISATFPSSDPIPQLLSRVAGTIPESGLSRRAAEERRLAEQSRARAGRDIAKPDVGEARPLRLVGHGGLPLAADAWGDPSAPPVILLHGGGQTRHAWGDTARALAAESWYAVSLDLRGHGDSAWAPDGNYSVEAYVADVRACAASFATRPVLVGASLGGIAALLAEGEADT